MTSSLILRTRFVENRKWGFWCKLPLFYHFCHMPTQQMKISDFPVYPFTNNLLPSSLYNLVFMKSPNCAPQHHIGYFIIPTIYYDVSNLLYGPNFSWSLILVMRSSLGLCNNVTQIFRGLSWASHILVIRFSLSAC